MSVRKKLSLLDSGYNFSVRFFISPIEKAALSWNHYSKFYLNVKCDFIKQIKFWVIEKAHTVSLIILLILALKETTLKYAENVIVNTKQKAVGQNSLNSSFV